MLKKANIRLTVIYSFLFLFSFWVFSFGLYFWMDKSFGESYINQVQEGTSEGLLDQKGTTIVTIAGDVAMERLRNILIILNGGLVIIIPCIAWFMTRRALAPVQRIHDQQRQFVSDVTHELRTPLSIMSGELEVALKKERTNYDYQQVLISSKQETDRLIELTENLLFLARRDQSKQAIAFERVDITDLIGSVIASLQIESSNKQIALHFQSSSEPVFAYSEPTMLRRLFFNIIHNAIIYTPSGGNVWISLSSNNQYSQVEVKDSGMGISPEDQEKIFNRFYRADSSRSQTKGYGLGLAICKSIVELHHGKITVRSTLGEGSTFTINLPITKG